MGLTHPAAAVLRQLLEDKLVTIGRAQGSLTCPGGFQWAAGTPP